MLTIIKTLSLLFSLQCFGIVVPKDFPAKCQQAGGVILDQWTCPKSGKVRKTKNCLVLDHNSKEMIFNGCSASIGNYGEVFYKACVYHDLCYHHEPTTHGLNKTDCDRQFLTDMIAICKNEAPEDTNCNSNANLFFKAVDIFGGSAWSCSKELADYPNNRSF